MQAVDNSHLIGKRGQGYVEEEGYGPETTVWHTASDVIQSASGAPIWKFIELYQKKHGEAPESSFVATGWDTIMLMAAAVGSAIT